MKPLPKLLILTVACLGRTAVGNAATLLTFDELPTPQMTPSLNYGQIPNGYGGLLWYNFGVLDGVIMPAGEGYNAGMVSPNNVAFNFDQYDRTAYISSSSAFNLYSAYLTAQVVNGMQVEVQGFVGTHLTYDNTYTLSASGPTLVNFNYNGIDQAKFIPVDPVTIFVMDNLTVDVSEPSTYTLMSVASALSGFFVRRTKIQVGEPQLNPLVPDALATLTRR